MKKFYSAVAALLCFAVFLLPIQGCLAQTELAALTETLGTAAASLEQLEGNSAAAATIAKDTTAAVNAINNWKNGSVTSDVIEALTILQDDINLLPINAQDQALIDLALGTVETILEIVAPGQTSVAVNNHNLPIRHVVLAKSVHSKKDFKKEWNALLVTHPQFASAHIN